MERAVGAGIPTLYPFTYWLLPCASAAATTAAVGLPPMNCCPLCSRVTCAHQHTADLQIRHKRGQQHPTKCTRVPEVHVKIVSEGITDTDGVSHQKRTVQVSPPCSGQAAVSIDAAEPTPGSRWQVALRQARGTGVAGKHGQPDCMMISNPESDQ